MQVTLMGATGQTGQLVLGKLLAAGQEVTALVRTPSKVTTQHARLRIIQGDVLRPADVTKAISADSVVISVIGARTLKPDTICTDSARIIIAAMRQQGARRYISISGAGLNDHAGFVIQSIVRPLILKNVYDDAVAQDKLITTSGLDWTIVRPYRLTNGTSTKDYRVADQPFRSPLLLRWTTRTAVADFMTRESQANQHVQRITFISTGSF
ncbi:MAG: NAD(P)H-binding protein [Ktedonobacterales bacterium]|nr:NAD(P)H-binding protein [Ktedonobacterales bacterium]